MDSPSYQRMARSVRARALHVPYLFNCTTSNFSRVRAKREAVKAGTSEFRVLVLGDSNVTGAGAGTSGSYLYNGAQARNWCSQAASRLTATHGIAATNELCVIGGNNAVGQSGGAYSTYDPRVNQGSWTVTNIFGYRGLGGDCFTAPNAAGAAWTFAPGVIFDQVRVTYVSASGYNTASLTVSGSASLATLNGNQASAVRDTGWINCTRAAGTVEITTTSTGSGLRIATVEVRDSQTHRLRLIQAGVATEKIAPFHATANPWSMGNTIATMSPDLVIVNGLTINDAVANTASATWEASCDSVIQVCQNAGADVLYVTGLYIAADAESLAYQPLIRKVCASRGVPWLEMHDRWRYEYNWSGKLMDAYHPNYDGYTDWAQRIADAVALG